ncbi:MAG: flagellar motor switch protein FliM [Lachnospiraceae bacterium]|nr:flagellar motor switch protein FliM [Lachnospiraceae bacterium]MBR4544233.1 flagellar motor switch protein FliM [Lachnospiraceae bacterium]
MGDVLSQEEIDNLLSAISNGEVDAEEIKGQDERSVKNYDFKRPAKFSKEHLRTLELIFEHYGRLLSTNLPVYLRKNIQVTVVSSETVTFNEFTNALSNPVILGIINFQPLSGNILIDLTSSLGYAFIDRMLGGVGEPLDKVRDFSEIEMGILYKIITISSQLLKEPWKNVIEVEPVLERIETNTQFAQIIAPNEMIAIVTLNVRMGEIEGFMNVCIPFMTIESIIDNLNTKFWFTNMVADDAEDHRQDLENLLRKVDVPVKALLGRSEIAVSDFLTLQPGDIIRLERRVDNELDIYVGMYKKFSAVPGTDHDRYAVRITSIYREEEEES